MSDSETAGPGRREVAVRVFATEYDDATLSHTESDEERAPNYVVTPTGARVNRLFLVGVLTSIEQVSDEVLRARIADPTGAFVVYAGQYQPDALAFLERAEPPAFVAVTGKARTFTPEDSDQVFTSVRPESINEVDADTRDRWIVGTTEQTLARVGTFARALQSEERGERLRTALREAGVDEATATGIPLAIDHYGTTPAYLRAIRETALDATRVVTGDLDEVDVPDGAPGDDGDEPVDLDELIDEYTPIGELPTPESAATAEPTADETVTSTTDETAASATDETTASAADQAAERTTDQAAPSATDEAATPSADDDTYESESSDTAEASADDELGDFEPGSLDAETDEEPAEDDVVEATAGGAEAIDDGADGAEPAETAAADLEEAPETDELYEIDEEERERIEEEYGTEFSTGTEVDQPGESDIDVPDPDAESTEPSADEETSEATAAPAEVDEAGSTDEAEADEVEPTTDEAADETEPEAADDEETEAEDVEADEGEAEDVEADDGETETEDVDLEDAVMDAMRDLDDGDGAEHEEIVATVVEKYGASADDVEDAIEDALMGGRCYEPDETTLKPI